MTIFHELLHWTTPQFIQVLNAIKIETKEKRNKIK